MVKKLLTGLLALCTATVAISATPPDLAPYVPINPVWSTDGTQNLPIDPVVTPAPQAGLAEVNPSISSGRIATTTTKDGTSSPFCLTTANGGTCQQAKFRTLSQVSHILFDDPVKLPGQPGASHCHEFFGNRHTNAYSTYSSLRTHNDSMSAGTDVNATGYWFPCPIKTNPFGDGKNYVVKTSLVIVYYLENDPTKGPRDTKLRRGLRYIFGRNLEDPDNSQLLKYIYQANQAQGHNRYMLSSSGNTHFSGEPQYVCTGATPSSSYVLKNADGSDPFNGTCNSGQDFYILIQGPSCWDGVNLGSPSGMSHVIKSIWDNDYSESVCPKNYYRIPALNQEVHFTQLGFADYGSWRLSSDDMMGTKLDSLPVCDATYSTVPCAITAGPHVIENGRSIHEDWMFGWDDATISTWETNCIGVEGGIPHECDTSQIDASHALIGGNANETLANGQIMNENISRFPTSDPANMFLLPSQSNGPKTLHTNGPM